MITIDFLVMSDKQIVNYLIEHYDELETGDSIPDLNDTLDGIASGSLAIEKRTEAFAIIERANRPPIYIGSKVDPKANLMFLVVLSSARNRGVGSALLQEIKQQYMEDQAMITLCAGERRREFFERAGFHQNGKTNKGLYCMVCHSIKVSTGA